MAVTASEFWNLLADSQLLAPRDLQRYQQTFREMKQPDAASDSSRVVAQWLISEAALTPYHCDVLRAGRSGPFLFGDYRLTERYTTGRLAGNFSAVHMPTGYPVMLQFLSGAALQSKPRWKQIAQQAEIARRMVHPALSRVYELLDLVTYKLVVVEELAGQTLEQFLQGGKRLSEADACRIARSVAGALAYYHANGQVHGEVRPANIWIGTAGQIKLLQPPLARSFARRPGEVNLSAGANDRRLADVIDYLAPELAQPEAEASVQSDIYAFGCTFYEMLAGRPPFAGGTLVEKVRRHVSEPVAPLTEIGISMPLGQMVMHMLAKETAQRYQQAGPLFDSLASFVDPAFHAPAADPHHPARSDYENDVARRQVELRSVQRQLDALPDVRSRFGRESQASGAALASGADEGDASLDFMADPSDKVEQRLSRAGKKEDSKRLVAYCGAGIAAIVAGILLVNLLSSSSSETPPVAQNPVDVTPPAVEPAGHTPPAAEAPTRGAAQGRVAADDGASLWASPTTGQPLELRYLPPGPQIFLALRPAGLLVHPEGEKIVAALGPHGERYLSDLKRITGFEGEEIDRLVIGMQAGDEIGVLDTSLVVHLVNPLTAEEIVARWAGAREATHEGQNYYIAGEYAYFIPPSEAGRTIAVTSPKYIRDLLQLNGAVLPLEREMERMLADTDADRHLTLLFPPKHIFGEAHQAVFSGLTGDLKKPLSDFLGDEEIKATAFSMHLDNHLFTELRVFGTLDIPPGQLAEQVHERLQSVPRQIRMLIFAMQSHPYSAQVLAEFPEMIRVFAQYTRSGIENNQAVLRSYLPVVAAHNLVLGSELAMAQNSGVPTTGGAVAAAPAAQSESIDQILQRKATLSFPRDTLEQSLRMLSEELGVEIIILGSDLQLDGITKNQSFGIDLRDQPARTILEQILVQANPDKETTGPSDAKQKLVYIIKPNNGKDAIFVTTRTQAERRGDKLPEEFVVK